MPLEKVREGMTALTPFYGPYRESQEGWGTLPEHLSQRIWASFHAQRLSDPQVRVYVPDRLGPSRDHIS